MNDVMNGSYVSDSESTSMITLQVLDRGLRIICQEICLTINIKISQNCTIESNIVGCPQKVMMDSLETNNLSKRPDEDEDAISSCVFFLKKET